jgi:hypothetical protein
MTQIFNKIVATENITSNQEGPFKEVKREIQWWQPTVSKQGIVLTA